MDIEAAVQRLIVALEDSDRIEAAEACDDICEWMGKRGFMPKLAHHQLEFILGTLADLLRK